MKRDKDQGLATDAAEQCRFEEVRLRVKRAGLNASRSHNAILEEAPYQNFDQIELEMQNAALRQGHAAFELLQKKYAEIYDFAPIGYFTFDEEGLIREVNLAGAGMLGIERPLLANTPFKIFIADDEGREAFSHHLESVLQHRETQRCEINLTGTDGVVIHVKIQSITVELLESKEGYILSSIVDCTDAKKLTVELQKTNDKLENIKTGQGIGPSQSDILANMSHELRSPLSSVIGFSEVLLDQLYGPINEKQKEYINQILASGSRLLALIDDIIDLSTVELGGLTLELNTFSLREALDAAVLMHRENALKNGVTLHLELTPQADVMIVADRGKFKRIMFTLLANAVKFTSAGGTVNVSIMRDGDCIEITVADTGLGIKVNDIPKLFQASPQQQEAANTGKDEEIGPGLVLIRQLVELHGGRIWVKSYFGMGSRFSFTLPLTQTDDGTSAHEANNQQGEGKTVLLIEDEKLTLAATEHALHDKGYQVLRAKDGEEGIATARRVLPDLIVLDLMLPGINGFDVVERLRNERVAENVPILILTSMKLLSADRERLAGKVWRIAGKGSLSTHEFINLVESAIGQNMNLARR